MVEIGDMLRTVLNMDDCVYDGKPLPLFIRRSGICDSLNITIWQMLRSKSMDAKLRISLTSFFYMMYDSPVQIHQYPANVKLIRHILQEMRRVKMVAKSSYDAHMLYP